MNFLALVQAVAQESGTVSGTQPSSVVGQTGRLKKMVDFTANAWDLIQNLRTTWRFMRADLECSITSGTQRYSASALAVPNWAAWLTEDDLMTIYRTSTGVSDEGSLYFMKWSEFRRRYDRGTQTNNRPVHYSISPSGELCFGPTPDDAYTVRGEYMITPIRLDEDDDEPGCPARFHAIIKHRALLLLAEHDEANINIATERVKYLEMLGDLELDQIPVDELEISIAPLA